MTADAKPVFCLLSLFLIVALSSPAFRAAPQQTVLPLAQQTSDNAARLAALEAVIRSEMQELKTPGAAVAVIHNRQVVFARGFGITSVEAATPVTAETLFRLGSTTKMFTGAALVSLAAAGKLKLDAPIGDYAKGLSPKLARLTAHQLASNTAGVADFAAPFVSHDDAALKRLVLGWKDDVLFADSGRIYSYSSPGFWLAGYCIEEISGGKPYADVMGELLFQPLGMQRTTFRPLVAMTYALALGHEVRGEAPPTVIRPAFNNVAMWPAGSIYSSVTDLSRFALALLADGKLDGRQVLPPSLFRQLAGRHAQMPGDADVHYGYGLLNFDYRGVRLLMHGGFSRGYGSMLQLAPEHGFAVIALTNRSGQTLPRSVEKAKELFLPLKAAIAPPSKRALPLTADDVRRFAGSYVNGEQVWEVLAKDGGLRLKVANTEFALQKIAADRLAYGEALENELVFVQGAGGGAEFLFDGLYAARRRR